MIGQLKAADEEQLLILEEEFRELALKEAEISAQLAEVRAAKQRVRRLVAEKKNRYAPIFMLPDELLVYIVEAGQIQPSFDEVARFQPSHATLSVEVLASHISQRFRWAVLGAPLLWTSIEFHWGVKSDAERFAAYLSRAQACTLSVTLKYSTYEGEHECDYEDVPNELLSIVQHIPRIRRLVIQCGGSGLVFEDAVAQFQDLMAPSLEYLDITSVVETPEFEESIDDRYASLFKRGAPRLTSLKLNNVYPALWVPWASSLTTFDLRGIPSLLDPYLMHNIFDHCRNLTTVTLDHSTFFSGEQPADGPISMLASALDWESDGSFSLFTGVLSLINAPALEILQFSGVHACQISGFFNLLSPTTFPALRALTFANTGVRCSKLHPPAERIRPSALRCLPALTSLVLVNTFLPPSADADTASRGLPRLRTLTLGYKDADELGISGWPRLPEALPTQADDSHDPLHSLRVGIAARAAAHSAAQPLVLRLPRSRFFTERDWTDHPGVKLEIFDPQVLLLPLGHEGEDEISDLLV
ncbi:hypothetical protein C8J57DRAFT_1272076 [Mycena rebaudengoi]|nr:hypothetical protein C8J57DRAFT_1272076 [Mycena rebaudengoi]